MVPPGARPFDCRNTTGRGAIAMSILLTPEESGPEERVTITWTTKALGHRPLNIRAEGHTC